MSGQHNQMAPHRSAFDVRQISPDDPDHRLALHISLGVSEPRPARDVPSGRMIEPPSVEEASQVDDLLARSRKGFISIDLLFGAYHHGELVSACLGVESAGAAAMVFIPSLRDRGPRNGGSDAEPPATLEALRALQQASWRRSIKLLEVLLAPGSNKPARVLEEAGFRYLTKLLYLARLGQRVEPSSRPAADLTWTGYTPEHEALFCDALDATYVQSLDCPELTGLRTTSDVLAGHRVRADFDPVLWWVALRNGAPVGVVLLNRMESQPGLEIVYVGVAQPSRGTGVADALLERTMGAVRQQNAKVVTLAVDERNIPARKMYARWNFAETMSREAFIASPPPI